MRNKGLRVADNNTHHRRALFSDVLHEFVQNYQRELCLHNRCILYPIESASLQYSLRRQVQELTSFKICTDIKLLRLTSCVMKRYIFNDAR